MNVFSVPDHHVIFTTKVVNQAADQLCNQAHYLTIDDRVKLNNALNFAQIAHSKQSRADGSPYVIHPIAVASLLATLQLDCDTLISGLLHDIIEDCEGIDFDRLEKEFGYHVAFLVNAVTKLEEYDKRAEDINLSNFGLKDQQCRNANLQYLMLSSAEDLRAMIIKLADRLHNLRTLYNLPQDKQRRIACETVDIYVPLASLLGMHIWKKELEDIAFATLNPKDNQHIIEYLDKMYAGPNDDEIKIICLEIEKLLKQSIIPYSQVVGRLKTPASIYRKSRSKSLDLQNLMDIVAFRIILSSKRYCYQTLGLLHHNFRHVPGTFDDYISAPKSNGYKSLHTVIIGPKNRRMEIQIRSVGMHKIAETGIAAHWRYKNDLKMSVDSLSLIAQIQEDVSEKKMKSIIMGEIDLKQLSKEVVVYTPKGGLVRLQAESTVLDFAFRIHSEVGLKFKQAYVNGDPVSIGHRITRGDTIKIDTDEEIKPRDFWLSHVKTHRAKTAIRQALDQQEATNLTVYLGELAREYNQELLVTIDCQLMRQLFNKFQVNSIDDLEEKLITAKIKLRDILHMIQPDINIQNTISLYDECRVSAIMQRVLPCPYCSPLPGDLLQGVWQVDKGIIAHRYGCLHLNTYIEQGYSATEVELESRRSRGNPGFTIFLDCTMPNRPGFLGVICSTLGEHKINIDDLNCLQKNIHTVKLRFRLHAHHKTQIDGVLQILQRRDVGYIITRPFIQNISKYFIISQEENIHVQT